MARAPLLQLSDISLTFGGDPIFKDLNLIVQPGDRVALVGRNGSGKSTLMKVMAGLVEPDMGSRAVTPGIQVSYMEQHPDLSAFRTLGEFASSGLEPDQTYRVEMAAEGLKFDPTTPVGIASGGERRRAALAKLLAESPDLMLLDEPTNHLDIEAIQWLESQLKETRTAFVLISHDRAFLNELTRATLWIDRGKTRRQEKGFAAFEAWRDKTWQEEDEARHKLDRKLKAEARWAAEGISARRTRNQGRLRAFKEMKAGRSEHVMRQGAAAMELDSGQKSGKRVVDAQDISKIFDGRNILSNFSLRIERGDRVALVGPNGVGKTTLLKILIGEIEPDTGSVALGTNLEVAVFDQNRSKLSPEMTLWDSLTGDPEMRVSGKADQIMVRGTPRHVVGYLKDFLFDERQARAKVKSLSGGEKARLLLAKIMARPSNLLVLDEPTNDLDVETLDLLQDILADYDGTVLLVSHDRDFLDRVAATTVAMEGDGKATVYAGGWSDYQNQRVVKESLTHTKPKPAELKASKKSKQQPTRLSFTEQHRLDALPEEIARLEAEIAKLEDYLSTPELFSTSPAKFNKATEALVERQAALAAAEDEWLALEEKAAEQA
ncbi:ABC-F family ATP-binding cassette domain-containing protein [Pseudohalocynthiibacter aestuariivivens]|uniref:ABC-F family ATP-binding cassette domain-containing protein n=1 Tax=Pseudohalocynthiibacter aestuariivivens TaxID=1591409 RepID=A0ABV5JFT0_9RHOB|nr:ATP-binding cassette domain-containing protein [Pseudohalocynthiibacter aestuariivivens]MBS9716348.1 ATP-binding cassette domain-containing protein [Pseudohalocynthiibacter aestuariivivens]